jgi:hypothetical protein
MSSVIPIEFRCPITKLVMIDPVIDKEGHVYERSAIESWIQTNHTSPFTRNPLTKADLQPHGPLRNYIEFFRSKHPNQKLDDMPFAEEGSVSNLSEGAATQVVVRTISNHLLAFPFSPKDTVLSLKRRIAERTGVKVEHQRMWYGGKELVNENLLEVYGVKHKSTLQLVTRAVGGRLWPSHVSLMMSVESHSTIVAVSIVP